MNTETTHPHFLMPVGPDTNEIELTVMGWFAAGHELLWVPIFEVDDRSGALAEAHVSRGIKRLVGLRLELLADVEEPAPASIALTAGLVDGVIART